MHKFVYGLLQAYASFCNRPLLFKATRARQYEILEITHALFE